MKLTKPSLFAFTFAGVLMGGCSSYRDVGDAADNAGLHNIAFRTDVTQQGIFTMQPPVSLWWEQLDDKNLEFLIERALAANHDIRIALASVNESRALLRNSRLQYVPSVTTEIAATRERQNSEFTALSGDIAEYNQAGASISWELDVFGRLTNQVKLSNAQLRASEADFHAVQLSMAAEVAGAYLRLRSVQSLIAIAEHSIAIQRQNLTLVEGFAKVGRGSDFDVSRAAAQFELTAARLPSLTQEYQLILNRLSVLTVLPFDELDMRLQEHSTLPTVPSSLAIGDAQHLIKRRPDIIRAEQQLRGAIAEYNVRVADLYPQVSLTGNFGYLSTEWTDLGKEQSETFRFSPAIRWAALDLTRVKTRIAAADARTQARLAEFEKTVLTALEETDSALTRFNQEEKRRQRLQIAANASAYAAELARLTYEKGRGDLRDVLDAELVRLNAAQQLVSSEMNILLSLVDIYKNLGGGWNVNPPTDIAQQEAADS